jgi:hypothetical protein
MVGGDQMGTGEMRTGSLWLIAIGLAVLMTGCNSFSSFSDVLTSQQSMPPQLTPEQETQEDQKCQSDGYQLNTPAYQYCRGELAKQRVYAEQVQAVPAQTAHR